MKVIDLKKRTIFVDDIIQLYIEDERYIIQTTHGTYSVYKEDYFKVKDYLLSLNDEVEIIEEDKKIEKIELTNGGLTLHKIVDDIEEDLPIDSVERTLVYTINEIIDYLEENK